MTYTSPYNGTLTSEQFLFHEMRTTAKLLMQGLTDEEARAAIVRDNLFQYPTSRTIGKLAGGCLRRLHAMKDDALIEGIAELPADAARQICLYAMMKQHRLVRDFMLTVVGEKYRTLDTSFSRADLNIFFARLSEQDDNVASWKDSTVMRIKGVLTSILVENGYLDNYRAGRLNPVLIGTLLEQRIRAAGDLAALPAFNCLH